MKGASLGIRLAISSLAAVMSAVLVFGVIAWHFVSSQIHRQAVQEASRQMDDAMRRLAAIDQLTRQQVETGMRILQQEGLRAGTPAVTGSAMLAGRPMPDLHLGSESLIENYALVDRVKDIAGGTATLFVWDGSDFVRATTNVQKADGSRAVGTVLDRKGPAFSALAQGRSFAGVVEILGVPYTTSYVPFMDGDGKLLGAWYTGYRLDSIASLNKGIEESRILDHGFLALLKPSGAAISHSKTISDPDLEQVLKHPHGWVVEKATYPAWGYSIVAAYPDSDVSKRLWKSSLVLASGFLIVVGAVVLFQYLFLKRLVSRPILRLVEDMDSADLNSVMTTDRNDEIGRLAESFNGFVLRLRETLLQVRDGSAASTAKSSQIRTVSTATVSRMNDQLVCAEDASAAVLQLSEQIAGTARHTNEAHERARSAATEARAGEGLVASTIDRIQALVRDTEQNASRIETLSGRVQQIGSIVEMIEEIAAGTNLLSLNASIEAARAGDQGRGFAVVAGEVRRLAERTAQATQQVVGLVNGIKAETCEAAAGIRTACADAQKGAEAVAGLNRSFEQISKLVVEVDGRIEQIAEAARHEASAATELSEKMRVVASSARESARGAEQVVDASDQLSGIAGELETLVERFEMRDLPQDCAA